MNKQLLPNSSACQKASRQEVEKKKFRLITEIHPSYKTGWGEMPSLPQTTCF